MQGSVNTDMYRILRKVVVYSGKNSEHKMPVSTGLEV